MTLLNDPAVVEFDGERTLLMHGDTLCTDDVAYQEFRAVVRNPDWQNQFRARSLSERHAFAAQARAESVKHTAGAKPEIMDVNQAAVIAAMRKQRVRTLIHGHTHRPSTHRFELDGQSAERIVLGDWYEQSSVLIWPRPSAGR
jgi:UDP-2,3-diacylglucosamine hydrolase